MSVTVNWDSDNKTIINIKSDGPFTWEEFHEAVTATYDLARSVDYKVGAIVHRSENGGLPQGNMIANFRRLMHDIPPNMTAFVIISPSPYGRNIANTFMKVYRDWSGRMALVANLDEARAYLNERTEKQ